MQELMTMACRTAADNGCCDLAVTVRALPFTVTSMKAFPPPDKPAQ